MEKYAFEYYLQFLYLKFLSKTNPINLTFIFILKLVLKKILILSLQVGWNKIILKRQVYEIWGFFNGYTYIGRASFWDPPLIFKKNLFCVVIELINLKDTMRLTQKTYLVTLQTGMPLANASKICRIYGYSTLPDYW